MWTAVKRHWANNFSDASKQGAINLFLGMYIPNENQTPLWELDSDIILHECDKNKLPKLHKSWWEHYLRRFEEKLPKDLRNDALNFYINYDSLKEFERPHFITDQRIPIIKVLEIDEMELITKEEKHLYIYDGIEQIIKQKIDKMIRDKRNKLKFAQLSFAPKELIIDNEPQTWRIRIPE